MKTMLRTLAAAVLGVICYAGVTHAAIAIDFTGTTVDWNDGTNYSLGWSFTANRDLYVNSLGVYAAPEFGTGNRVFTQNHAVGIFDASKNLVASTSVSNADPLNNFFRYHSLETRVQLTAGATYYIAAAMGADQFTWNTTDFSVNPLITYTGSYYTVSDTLAFPTTADDMTQLANGTFGPNMDVTPTPIPAAFWLLGSGLGMIGAARRKLSK
ncbi:MAG: hypothetical protein FD174_1616 [Geobacteraceae bacterium]|nr:MAG: hypothetical protein FD174_1616 [Geobacteraceae bacterium]